MGSQGCARTAGPNLFRPAALHERGGKGSSFMRIINGSLAACVAAALLANVSSAALAQGGGWGKAADSAMVPAFGMTADDVEDLDVVNAAGDKIGEIEDVLTKEGAPMALGVEFEGFSDYSPGKDLDVIVPLDEFTLVDKNKLGLKADAAAVKAMATYPD
jgi:hypothetical protein